MYAIRVNSFGGPEVLEREEVPIPAVGPTQVLIRVHAVGINPVDVRSCVLLLFDASSGTASEAEEDLTLLIMADVYPNRDAQPTSGTSVHSR